MFDRTDEDISSQPTGPTDSLAGQKANNVPLEKPSALSRARKQKITRHSRKLPDDGMSLFLGWEGTEHVPTLGFKPSNSAKLARSPLTYSGDGHLMTVAPTGAGKGVGVIIPALLTYPGSVIVTDIKGENYQVTARYRRQMGKRVVVLDRSGSPHRKIRTTNSTRSTCSRCPARTRSRTPR